MLKQVYETTKIGKMLVNFNNLVTSELPPPTHPMMMQQISPYSPFAPRRRGRRPKDYNLGFDNYTQNQSYYMSIKACVMGHTAPLDKS